MTCGKNSIRRNKQNGNQRKPMSTMVKNNPKKNPKRPKRNRKRRKKMNRIINMIQRIWMIRC